MEAFEGQNWGNVKKFEIVLRSEVNFQENKNPLNIDDISFNNGANFVEILFILESAFFTEKEERSDVGLLWSKNAGLKLPKLRTDVTTFLQRYAGVQLVARITDMNDIVHLVSPLRMLRQRTVPGAVTGLNHTMLEFSGSSIYESPVITDASYSGN